MTPERIGPYRVERMLGSGGMGAVYEAYDERLERRVAIKSVHPSKELSVDRLERLHREAKAAAGLNHPAIAQVHDILTEDDNTYIVMEFVEGRTLAELLVEGPLELDTALDLGRQIAEGLDAAHAKGIVHRDLKTENVMVTPSGQVKILDFGLAKRIDPTGEEMRLTEEGMVVGTCSAMSPEQAEGRPVDHRSDLFALGTLLYRMVTGAHPFAAGTPLATMRRIVAHTPDPADRLNPAVPRQLAVLLERLLDKDPAERPSDGQEVAAFLRAHAERGTGAEAPTTRMSLVGPGPPRARALAWTVGLGAIAAVVAVVVATTVLRTRHLPAVPVAVLAPEIVAEGSERTPLVARATRESLLNTVAALEGLTAVNPDAVDAITGTPAEVALAVAADELVAATVEEVGATFRVSLRRLDCDDGSVLWSSGVFELPGDNLSLLADAVAANLRRGYPELRPRPGTFTSEASPEDYEAYLRISQQLDDPPPGVSMEELLDELAEIRRRSPRFLEVYVKESATARYLYLSTRREGFLHRAREAAEEARDLAPEDPRTFLPVIELALSSGDLDTADAAIFDLQRLGPGMHESLTLRADLEELRGDLDAALDLRQRMLGEQPSWANFRSLARLELMAGRVEDARAHLQAGLQRAPHSRSLLSKLAELELLHGHTARAAALYEELCGRFEHPIYLSNLGMARMLSRDYENAVKAYSEALRLAPEDPATLLNLADCRTLLGEADQARTLYSSALEFAEPLAERGDIEAMAVKAQCLAHLGEPVRAAEAVQEELRLAPDDPHSMFDAALVYTLIGDRSSALLNAQKALEAGFQPQWFELPWFDELRNDPAVLRFLSAEE